MLENQTEKPEPRATVAAGAIGGPSDQVAAVNSLASPAPSRGLIAVYVALVAALCLLPSVGLLFGGGELSSDADAVSAPKLVDENGALNVGILGDAGDWFNDHFAFRNELVTAAALIEGGLFGVSSDDGVVYGTDGWLYYSDSVDDFRGTNQLSDRALFNIAHSMRLVQNRMRGQGVDFAFVISPNKNTLYGANMPYYYQVKAGDSNLDRIVPLLESEGVNYVDARALLEGQGSDQGVSGGDDGEALVQAEPLYHARDSHWNNKGAAMVADALLTALGQAHRDYAQEPYEERVDFVGDLDKMLFPAAPTAEAEVYYVDEPRFEYVTEGVESNFDPKIETRSADTAAAGSLVMYRDSFANTLLPFMAEAFASAYFSRAVPYQLNIDLDAHSADALVVERAQRFMPDMAAHPPIMPAPLLTEEQLDVLDASSFSAIADAEEAVRGDYVLIAGEIPEEGLAVDARIAVRVNGNLVYEAFGATDVDTGAERFQLLVPRSILGSDGNEYELALW